MLGALQLAEFIYEQPAMGDIEYMFKHALTLEVAYNSVLLERRRLLHERAGQAMEGLFTDRLEDHVAELAHHYDRSGNARKAVEYLERAGARAAQEMAQRVIGRAQAAGAPAMLAGAHSILGLVLSASGRLDAAREHLERALELFAGEALNAPLVRSTSTVLPIMLFLLGHSITALGK